MTAGAGDSAGRGYSDDRCAAAHRGQMSDGALVIVAMIDQFGTVPGKHGLEGHAIIEAASRFGAAPVRRVVDHHDAGKTRLPGLLEPFRQAVQLPFSKFAGSDEGRRRNSRR